MFGKKKKLKKRFKKKRVSSTNVHKTDLPLLNHHFVIFPETVGTNAGSVHVQWYQNGCMTIRMIIRVHQA